MRTIPRLFAHDKTSVHTHTTRAVAHNELLFVFRLSFVVFCLSVSAGIGVHACARAVDGRSKKDQGGWGL